MLFRSDEDGGRGDAMESNATMESHAALSDQVSMGIGHKTLDAQTVVACWELARLALVYFLNRVGAGTKRDTREFKRRQ